MKLTIRPRTARDGAGLPRHIAGRVFSRIKRRPLGARQEALLAHIRRAGKVPSEAGLMERFPTFHRVTDLRTSLLALEARGFLRRLETRFGPTGGRIVTAWVIAETTGAE